MQWGHIWAGYILIRPKILKGGGKKPENQIWLSSPFGCASSTGVWALQQPELCPGLSDGHRPLLLGRLDPMSVKALNCCDLLQKQIAKSEGVAILATFDSRLGEISQTPGFGGQCWPWPVWAGQTPLCCAHQVAFSVPFPLERAAKQSLGAADISNIQLSLSWVWQDTATYTEGILSHSFPAVSIILVL